MTPEADAVVARRARIGLHAIFPDAAKVIAFGAQRARAVLPELRAV